MIMSYFKICWKVSLRNTSSKHSSRWNDLYILCVEIREEIYSCRKDLETFSKWYIKSNIHLTWIPIFIYFIDSNRKCVSMTIRLFSLYHSHSQNLMNFRYRKFYEYAHTNTNKYTRRKKIARNHVFDKYLFFSLQKLYKNTVI